MSEDTNIPTSAPVEPAAPGTATPNSPESVPSVAPSTPAAGDTTPAAPSSDTAPAVVPATETTPVVPEAVKSVLGDAPAPVVKPEGDKPVIPETKPVEVDKPADQPATLPTYESFKLPENVQLEAEPMNAFTKVLGELETSKLDHDGFQKYGQQLIDMHVSGVTDALSRQGKYYADLHEQQKTDWFKAFEKDPEIGGNHKDTTISNVRSAISTYGGTETQVAEFRQVMQDTGVGNNPAVIRVLANMDAALRRFTSEDGTKIIPGNRPAPSKVKDYQRFYSGSNQ